VSFFDNIKEYFARQQLKKEIAQKPRVKNIISLDEAKIIGVLYTITDEETYNEIFNFMRSLKSEQRTVISLGFIHDKKVPTFLTQGVYNSIFTLKDLNWYNKPVNQYVSNFFKEDFDVFLNISMEDYYPLLYICAMTNAGLKVGRYADKYKDFLDIMIKSDGRINQAEFIQHIVHYLKILNNPKK
jgi:hypothetical protein